MTNDKYLQQQELTHAFSHYVISIFKSDETESYDFHIRKNDATLGAITSVPFGYVQDAKAERKDLLSDVMEAVKNEITSGKLDSIKGIIEPVEVSSLI